MSFATTYNAFQISGITKAEQHVLTAICTFADKNGVCWPTTETIAARCLSSVRTVQTHIHALVSKGLLQRIYRKGKPALTKVLIGQAATPATFSPRPPQFLHPEPVIEPVNTKTALPEPATPLPDTADAAIVVVEKIPELPVIPDVEPTFRTPSCDIPRFVRSTFADQLFICSLLIPCRHIWRRIVFRAALTKICDACSDLKHVHVLPRFSADECQKSTGTPSGRLAWCSPLPVGWERSSGFP